MTNAEKFFEVFGFEWGTVPPCNEKSCETCTREDDCIDTYWQSEYKEPKKEQTL